MAKPSYLYGTMHVSNKVAFHLSDSFYKAIANVDVVALEINPETWMQTMTSDPFVADRMGNVFSVRGDYSSSGFYTSLFKLEAPTNRQIGAALASELGILNSLLYRNDNYGVEFQEDTYLDLFIYQAGKKQGKEITGLEQLGTTMRLGEIAAKPETDKEKKKANKELALKRRFEIEKLLKGKNFNEVMEDAYRRGDLDLLDSLSRMSGGSDKYHDYIIVHRNIGMADDMDSIMRQKPLFAGIGAAHLPNTYGVINLLREMGYRVESVQDDKTDFGRGTKDRLEETFITQDFTTKNSFDGSFKMDLPGPLYEFPDANNTVMAAYPDMANGATYVTTRLFTFAPLYGITPQQYMAKIDSLLFENIPGKILEKKEIYRNGVPGYEITNHTKKGDVQHYFIMVKPLEIVVYKIGGKKKFVYRSEVQESLQNFGFVANDVKWNVFSPKNNAYQINMPGSLLCEAENNAFERGFWKKTVQSYSSQLGYYMVLNRGYSNLQFIEEDSFELSQLSRNFANQFDYTISTWDTDSILGYPGFSAIAQKEGMPDLFLQSLIAGDQYYLLAAQSDDKDAVNQFQKSFRINSFTYSRPFVEKEDSSLFFTVKTNVEASPANEYLDFYYYSDDEDADNTHEEEQKRTSYYNKSSDEEMIVKYKRFHKYFSQPNIDSVWADASKEWLEETSFYIKSEKKWKDENLYLQELEVGDTNSQRTLLIRNILNTGVLYSLITEVDNFKPRSAFVDTFFSTFSPWDTVLGTPILQNKASLFLTDLRSEDSLTREAAYQSFGVLEFADEDVPKIIRSYNESYDEKHSLQIRAELLSSLSGLNHSQIIPFLEKTYLEVGDTIMFQMPILSALGEQKTSKSAKLFAELITTEAPLSSYSRESEYLLRPFIDSSALCKELFPRIFKLSTLPEYKNNIYDLLAVAVNKGDLKPRRYKRQVKDMVWEATNELKRQKSKESMNGLDFLKANSRSTIYNYNFNLERFFTILMPFHKNKKVKDLYSRAASLNSPAVQMDLAVLRQKYGIEQDVEVWHKMVESANDRIELYQRMQSSDLLEYYPKSVTQDELVYSLYAQRSFLNLEKDSLHFIQKDWITVGSDTGYVYFFKSKTKNADDWEYGYIGTIDTASSKALELWGYEFEDDFGFNKFEDEALQLKMQLRKLEMMERKRYRVSDEPEFKNLQTSRNRYSY